MRSRWKIGALLLSVAAIGASLGFVQLAPSGVDLTAAADRYVKSLSAEQQGKAVMPYDSPQRTDWHYIPKPTRKGLQLKEMDETQRRAALAMLQAALSASGYDKATRIMQLETVLIELEKNRRGGMERDPRRYFFTVFGQVSANGRWGLSVEGHHLSLNFVVENNRLTSTTPTFYGANPATLQADYGAEFPKGYRILAKEEDLAFQLLAALSSEQRKAAVIAEKAPNDVRGASKASPPVSPAVGLAASEMTADQKGILRALVDEYARNVPTDVAAERLAAVEKAGFDKVKFAWSGGDKPGVGHDYRVQGETFLIEFNNTQPDSAGNVANHIHSVWHNLSGNFALPADAP